MIRIYMVGGAVRDELLGLPVRDHDWVVVGATPEDMLAQGFRPVGKDFPVFLHPKSGEEYALARTERKSGRGYKGFAFHATPDVTLEQDLLRRDLTINAMARDRHGALVDPHGGRQDLKDKLLRHVSPAFAEDPLRILRVARFAARFTDFSIAPETLELMRDIVAAGEIEHLVAERVWQELARGLMEARPARMIRVLRECGALAELAPELETLFVTDDAGDGGEQALAALDRAAARNASITVRWACLLHRIEGGAEVARALSERLKAPNDCRDLAVLLVREYATFNLPATDAEGMFDLLQRTDAWRRPERFAELLQSACYCADEATLATRWQRALEAALTVDAGAIAAGCTDKILIPQRVRAARIAAIAARPEPDTA